MFQAFVRFFVISIAVATSAAAMTSGGRAPANTGGLRALNGIERGEWELRERGTRSTPRRICLEDPAQLLQVQHPGASCRRYVVTDAANRAVVTYHCSDRGAGRTDLRVETSRLVQIDAQGVSDSAPFSMSLEGRRVGNCE